MHIPCKSNYIYKTQHCIVFIDILQHLLFIHFQYISKCKTHKNAIMGSCQGVAQGLLGVQSDCDGFILSSCGIVLISCQGVAMSFLTKLFLECFVIRALKILS